MGTQPQRDWIKAAYRDYVLGKQTLSQLALGYDKAISTLQRQFDRLHYAPRMLPPSATPVSVVCDTTFFGRQYGVLVFRAEGKTLWWRFVLRETAAETRTGLHQLMAVGWRIQAITLDGKRSTLTMLRKHYPDIPVQLCQYHVIQGMRRILGPKPATEFGRELLALALQLTRLDQDSFADRFLYLTRYRFPNHRGRRDERKATRAVSLRAGATLPIHLQKLSPLTHPQYHQQLRRLLRTVETENQTPPRNDYRPPAENDLMPASTLIAITNNNNH